MTELPIDENTPRILIVEDEPKLGQLLIDYLRAASYAPTLINHGDKVLPYVRQTPPDLILLDLMLPGTDGLTLCREIRRFSDIPIVMVTAKIEEIDRLLGLEIGADDYICKPYSPREVVARVKTILRRCKPQRELQQQDAESPLMIDESRFQASWCGKALDLTPAEFRLLKTLSLEPGKVFSREQLLNHLYDDYRVVTDRTIDSHIKNLRRKLESLDAEQSFIRAVYGVGYRWEADACRRFSLPQGISNSGIHMKKTLLAVSAALALTSSFTANAAENDQPQYLSDWWHQSVNVVGSYHTRFSPKLNNDVYLEYEAFAKKDWFDFYGYIDIPKTFDWGNGNDKGIWSDGSPLFMEIEPRFSIDKLTGADLSFGPFKEWYFANNYIYDMGDNKASRQSTWYMGLGTDIDTGLPMGLSLNVYAKYQWQNYGASNENEWDGYRFKVKYFVPITDLWGGKLSYIGFTNFDWGSDLGDDPNRTSNSIASSHILALNYDHWHYSVVARYFHNGGQWQNGAKLNWGDGDFSAKSTGWGGYLVVGYNF